MSNATLIRGEEPQGRRQVPPRTIPLETAAPMPTLTSSLQFQEWAAWDFHFSEAAMVQITAICTACLRNIELGRQYQPNVGWTRRDTYIRGRLAEATLTHGMVNTLYTTSLNKEGVNVGETRSHLVKLRHLANTLAVILDESRIVEEETSSHF